MPTDPTRPTVTEAHETQAADALGFLHGLSYEDWARVMDLQIQQTREAEAHSARLAGALERIRDMAERPVCGHCGTPTGTAAIKVCATNALVDTDTPTAPLVTPEVREAIRYVLRWAPVAAPRTQLSDALDTLRAAGWLDEEKTS